MQRQITSEAQETHDKVDRITGRNANECPIFGSGSNEIHPAAVYIASFGAQSMNSLAITEEIVENAAPQLVRKSIRITSS
jgi:hypothetical protein